MVSPSVPTGQCYVCGNTLVLHRQYYCKRGFMSVSVIRCNSLSLSLCVYSFPAGSFTASVSHQYRQSQLQQQQRRRWYHFSHPSPPPEEGRNFQWLRGQGKRYGSPPRGEVAFVLFAFTRWRYEYRYLDCLPPMWLVCVYVVVTWCMPIFRFTFVSPSECNQNEWAFERSL